MLYFKRRKRGRKKGIIRKTLSISTGGIFTGWGKPKKRGWYTPKRQGWFW